MDSGLVAERVTLVKQSYYINLHCTTACMSVEVESSNRIRAKIILSMGIKNVEPKEGWVPHPPPPPDHSSASAIL